MPFASDSGNILGCSNVVVHATSKDLLFLVTEHCFCPITRLVPDHVGRHHLFTSFPD